MMKTLKNKVKSSRGFTLVELLVVIAIIAILSVTAYVALGGQTGKARDARRQQDLASIQSAVELYGIENSSQYPETLQILKEAGKLAKIPLDPTTDQPYAYKTEPPFRKYQLGATLEGDEGSFKAYVIGNSDKPMLDGVPTQGNDCAEGVVEGSAKCVPMDIWSK